MLFYFCFPTNTSFFCCLKLNRRKICSPPADDGGRLLSRVLSSTRFACLHSQKTHGNKKNNNKNKNNNQWKVREKSATHLFSPFSSLHQAHFHHCSEMTADWDRRHMSHVTCQTEHLEKIKSIRISQHVRKRIRATTWKNMFLFWLLRRNFVKKVYILGIKARILRIKST